MRLTTGHLIAALVAAVALFLAFVAAGLGLVALVLAVIGSLAVGWLVWSLLRRVMVLSRARTRAKNRAA
jgi:hypothetical protein